MNEDAIFDLADKIFGERNYSRGRVKALYEAAFGRGVSEGARMVRESFQKAAAQPVTHQGVDVGVCVVNCADHYSVEFMGGGVIRKFPHEDYACAMYFAQGYRAALAMKNSN